MMVPIGCKYPPNHILKLIMLDLDCIDFYHIFLPLLLFLVRDYESILLNYIGFNVILNQLSLEAIRKEVNQPSSQ